VLIDIANLRKVPVKVAGVCSPIPFSPDGSFALIDLNAERTVFSLKTLKPVVNPVLSDTERPNRLDWPYDTFTPNGRLARCILTDQEAEQAKIVIQTIGTNGETSGSLTSVTLPLSESTKKWKKGIVRTEIHFSNDEKRVALVGYSLSGQNRNGQVVGRGGQEELRVWIGVFDVSPPRFLYEFWGETTKKDVYEVETIPDVLSFSPDGKRIAMLKGERTGWHKTKGEVRILDAEQRRELPVLKSLTWFGMLTSYAVVSPDWSRVVIVDPSSSSHHMFDDRVWVWNIPEPVDLRAAK